MDDQVGAGEWLPLADAAIRLGISIDWVRRKVKRGDLEARREQRPQGYRWLVRLPVDSQVDSQVGHTTDSMWPSQVGVGELVKVMDRLQEQMDRLHEQNDRLQRDNVRLASQVAFLQAQAQQYQAQLWKAQEQIKLFEALAGAPSGSPESPLARRRGWRFRRRSLSTASF